MKAIVIKFDRERGFGFLKDEKQENRFFHISNVIQKKEFLSLLPDYLYSDWDGKCLVVEFTPDQNGKGLNAVNISLTNQKFNDISAGIDFDALVTGVKYDVFELIRTVSGIKKGMSAPLGATGGSNGTYRIGYPEVGRELNIYFRRVDDIGWGRIDVRDLVLSLNDRSKITESFVKMLRDNLINSMIRVSSNGNSWLLLDESILRI